MGSEIFTRPIGRWHYLLANIFISVLLIGLMKIIFDLSAPGRMSTELYIEKFVEFIPLLLLFISAKVIISYKRLRDITFDRRYLYLLIFPAIGSLMKVGTMGMDFSFHSINFFIPHRGSFFDYSIIFSLIGLGNLIFGLYLLLKKGGREKTPSIFEQKPM